MSARAMWQSTVFTYASVSCACYNSILYLYTFWQTHLYLHSYAQTETFVLIILIWGYGMVVVGGYLKIIKSFDDNDSAYTRARDCPLLLLPLWRLSVSHWVLAATAVARTRRDFDELNCYRGRNSWFWVLIIIVPTYKI